MVAELGHFDGDVSRVGWHHHTRGPQLRVFERRDARLVLSAERHSIYIGYFHPFQHVVPRGPAEKVRDEPLGYLVSIPLMLCQVLASCPRPLLS